MGPISSRHGKYMQGRRKHQKIGGGGGAVSMGTFGMKRALAWREGTFSVF